VIACVVDPPDGGRRRSWRKPFFLGVHGADVSRHRRLGHGPGRAVWTLVPELIANFVYAAAIRS